MAMEWQKFWILGIQTSAKVIWFGDLLDGKSIHSLHHQRLCLKFPTLMFPFHTILEFLVSLKIESI